MMNKRVSLKDIAEKVGVSTALVSYVLNNQKEDRISKEVAEKIRQTAKKLHYRPNQIAKSLKSSKTFTIGLIVADIANPFFATLARMIEDEAEKNGYTVIFGSSDESAARSEKLIEVFTDRSVDGIILAPAEGSEQQIKQLKKQGIPLVLIDRYFPDLKVNSVGVDNYRATFEATQYVINKGRKRIGMIGFGTQLPNLLERKLGFVEAIKVSKLTPTKHDIAEVSLEARREEVEAAIDQLLALPKPIDALFFASNKLSTIGLKYINQLPLEVPKDLALYSFDESDAIDLFYAPLTHVRQPLRQMGEQAVSRLLQIIQGDKKYTHVGLSAELIVGQST